MTLYKRTLFLISLTILTLPAFAQKESIFDEMHFQEVLEITLETNLEAIENSRRSDDYQSAFLTFQNEEGINQSWKVKVKTRGKFRRQVCEMPPVKIKFKKAELAVGGFNEFNDMKLVTHCVNDKLEAKQLLMKEYLAYQMYGKLSAYSFRTQLVRITYKDINTGRKFKNWGFLIEDTAQLAARIEAKNCKDCYNMPSYEFQSEHLKMVDLFNYMIGNADYDVNGMRNVKIFRKGDELIPVPYDFDFSGIVNASYAIPSSDYGLQQVTDRVYLGSMDSLHRLHSTKSYFFMKEKKFVKLIETFRRLDRVSKDEMVSYIQNFYSSIHKIEVRNRTLADANGSNSITK